MSRTTAPRTWVAEFVLLAAIWGSSFLFMRLGAADFGPLATAFLRVSVAAAAMLVWVTLLGQLGEMKRAAPRLMVVGVLNSAIPFALFSYAVLHITTGLASVLNATVPLFGALVAWVWLEDRPNKNRLVGLAIGFAGVALLASGKASFKPGGSGWAVLACLGATLCYGVAASYTKRYLQGVPPATLATGSQVAASLALALPAAFAWPKTTPGAAAWGALLALALVCTALAYFLYFRLMVSVGPSKTLTVTFLIPVFGVIYGALLLNEAVTPLMLGSGVVIVIGTALASGLVQFSRK